MDIGVPSVFPSNTPESISTVSGSLRWVVILLWPGRLLSSSNCMSAGESSSPAGQPSTTTPTAAPCDSPQVVIRNSCPKEFPGINEDYINGQSGANKESV